MKTLGQVGFEAWYSDRGNKDTPSWKALGPSLQEAWEAAAQAIAKKHEGRLKYAK